MELILKVWSYIYYYYYLLRTEKIKELGFLSVVIIKTSDSVKKKKKRKERITKGNYYINFVTEMLSQRCNIKVDTQKC